jgi:hypothetical protein
LAAVTAVGYRLSSLGNAPALGLRLSLAGIIGALGGYNYYALALPGADALAPVFGVLAPTVFIILGGGLGLLAGWFWFVRRRFVPKE